MEDFVLSKKRIGENEMNILLGIAVFFFIMKFFDWCDDCSTDP